MAELLKVVRDRTVTEDDVFIDGTEFVDCVFIRCHLHYDGGPFNLIRVGMDGNVWHFTGHASRTIGLLRQLGVLHGEPQDWIAKALSTKH